MEASNCVKAGLLLALVGWFGQQAWGQMGGGDEPTVSGNVSVMWQSYAEDSLIGAQVPPSKTGYNAFANLLNDTATFVA